MTDTPTTPKPTKNLIEVPFNYSISGTRLVAADDNAKGKKPVIANMPTDDKLVSYQWFVSENRDVTLKDGLRISRNVGIAARSNLKPEDIDRIEHHFNDEDRIALGLAPNSELGYAAGSGTGRMHDGVSPDGDTDPTDQQARQGQNKPFDEDHDGLDKPGDDRKIGQIHENTSGVPRPGGIGMRDSHDVKVDLPKANLLSTPPNPQRTGDPTTTRTSAGAVDPRVNRPMVQPTVPPKRK